VNNSTVCQHLFYSEKCLKFLGISIGAGGAAWLILVSRILITEMSEPRNPVRHSTAQFTLFAILSISFTSQIIIYSRSPAFTCEDIYGVRLPPSMWAEWLSTVPLMFYLTIILDPTKTNLTKEDIISIITSGFGIFLLIIPALQLPYLFSVVCFITANISMASALLLLLFISSQGYKELKALQKDPQKPMGIFDLIKLKIARRKYFCSAFLNVFLTIFALVYYLKVLNIFDHDTFFIVISFLNFLAKNMFAIIVMDAHAEFLDPMTFQLLFEKHANDTRRGFLRYVFHEVRVPLNSVSIGLQLLSESTSITESDREILDTVCEATTYMGSTLNDVLSIQKIEEGMFTLEFKEFRVQDMVTAVVSCFKGQILSKTIQLSIHYYDNIPCVVIGDRYRLEHVLGNILSNAIKLSDEATRVSIHIRLADSILEQLPPHYPPSPPPSSPNSNNTTQIKPSTKTDEICITFSVVDEGPGIAEEDLVSLFKPFTQIRPGELQQGRGSGVGLAICKDIVKLHGGTLGCRSKVRTTLTTESGGSEFYFTIPFKSSRSG